MIADNIIVKEYLENLKEDGELDFLFPILLNLMGFRIITTAKESKGQPQYGKDIIAIKKDDDGIKKRYYFELKGHADKNIDQTSFLKPDGIRESILESKITDFKDSSIPNFNTLPIVIVVVHNGIIKSNTRKTFDDFIQKEFPAGGFERWDIYHLTDLFSKYLFSEYLLTDEESARLFKRTLVLLDAPDYDFSDFKILILKILENIINVKTRAFNKSFATLKLISHIILTYSVESNNLNSAKECLTFLVLKTWAWILKHNLETKSAVVAEFRKLLLLHHKALDEYFKRTIPVTREENGLFSENGGLYEAIGYPMRSFEYLNYLIYYYHSRLYWPKYDNRIPAIKKKKLLKKQKELLFEIINSNSGSKRPLIDNHSIAILNVTLFILKNDYLTHQDVDFIRDYIISQLDNILLINVERKRFPELHNNIKSLINYSANHKRPADYIDASSMLIQVLFELLAILKCEVAYSDFRNDFHKAINLQTAHPLDRPGLDIEQNLFEKNISEYMFVDHSLILPETFEELYNSIKTSPYNSPIYRTDKAGFSFLRILAHIYFKNEFFVPEWRGLAT